MIRVRWADGYVSRAESWEALDQQVAALPWNRTHPDMREELARRCYVLTGELVDPRLPAEAFWAEVAEAGMIEILDENESPTERSTT